MTTREMCIEVYRRRDASSVRRQWVFARTRRPSYGFSTGRRGQSLRWPPERSRPKFRAFRKTSRPGRSADREFPCFHVICAPGICFLGGGGYLPQHTSAIFSQLNSSLPTLLVSSGPTQQFHQWVTFAGPAYVWEDWWCVLAVLWFVVI